MVELTGDTTPDIRAIEQADVIVTTPEKWDGISRSWQNRCDQLVWLLWHCKPVPTLLVAGDVTGHEFMANNMTVSCIVASKCNHTHIHARTYVQAMRLLVIDEIHLLGDERGPVLEVIVSRTNFIASHTERPVRVVGLSTALANAKDLADWLGIKQVGVIQDQLFVVEQMVSIPIDA